MNHSNAWASLLLARVLATTIALTFASIPASANDVSHVRASALEVKARIQSMEQVNVTAEKEIDERAPAPSADVAQLLAELAELDAPEANPPVQGQPAD